MPDINLLPWRDVQRQRQQKRFLQVCILVVLACVMALLLTGQLIRDQISAQHARNRLISNAIEQVNRETGAIEEIRQLHAHWLERLGVIRRLQQGRAQIVEQFNVLTQLLSQSQLKPRSQIQTQVQLYLTRLEQSGDQLILKGTANDNHSISELMRQLAQAPLLDKPTLTDISTHQNRLGINHFTLKVLSKTQQTEVIP